MKNSHARYGIANTTNRKKISVATANFGYRGYKTPEALEAAYRKLYEAQIIPAKEKGLAACVYTQLSDVEDEVNGLVTYDRRAVKLPVSAPFALNAQLKRE